VANSCDVIIIGAGPAGLATAAALKARGLNAAVLEKSNAVGAVWLRHSSREFDPCLAARGTPRTFIPDLDLARRSMPAPAGPRFLACRPATVAIVPRRQIAVGALGRLRSGLRCPRRSHSPRGAQARQQPSTPEQKTGALMLFPAVDCRKHLASAARLIAERRARIPGRAPSVSAAWKCSHADLRSSSRILGLASQRLSLDALSC
jgi:NAD(P)-binding Rossmann-like domain